VVAILSERNLEPVDALFRLLRSSIAPDGSLTQGYLVLYTSFGVVRGRTGLSFNQELIRGDAGSALDVIELNDVTVEHYSNHLPSASFERLFLRLREVQGFAMVGPKAQP
jgi:hypothetical protein